MKTYVITPILIILLSFFSSSVSAQVSVEKYEAMTTKIPMNSYEKNLVEQSINEYQKSKKKLDNYAQRIQPCLDRQSISCAEALELLVNNSATSDQIEASQKKCDRLERHNRPKIQKKLYLRENLSQAEREAKRVCINILIDHSFGNQQELKLELQKLELQKR